MVKMSNINGASSRLNKIPLRVFVHLWNLVLTKAKQAKGQLNASMTILILERSENTLGYVESKLSCISMDKYFSEEVFTATNQMLTFKVCFESVLSNLIIRNMEFFCKPQVGIFKPALEKRQMCHVCNQQIRLVDYLLVPVIVVNYFLYMELVIQVLKI